MLIYNFLKLLLIGIALLLLLFGAVTAFFYAIKTAKHERNWTPEHQHLARVAFAGDTPNNPQITVHHLRDFQWKSVDPASYKTLQFHLNDIVGLKAMVSHFSTLSDIAHVFMTFVLKDGRELGISIEARREQGESFSLQGGLSARFELIYVMATPQDLLEVRSINKEIIHAYPIKETPEKAQELFLLIAGSVNKLNETPELYHLFFKNCTNQLVKHVSILTEKKYPWYFQTLAPGKTGRILYELNLIDIEADDFATVQEKTRISY